TTDAQGRFTLPGEGQRVTAWKEGYFIAGTAWDGRSPITLRLRPLPTEDYAEYEWVDPRPVARSEHRCSQCHEEIFREWHGSAHSRSAQGEHLLGLYAGVERPGQPDTGWNLLKQHPLGASVCAACHAPTIEPSDPGYDDLRETMGVARLGVHCDYCHKIADVNLDGLGTEHGRFGHRLLRPREGQLFFGPLPDVDRDEDTFAPLYRQSRYCASCHEGTVFGAPVYTTYSEWQASPAAKKGQTCQSCHMAPTGTMTNIAPGKGGWERDPQTLASHTSPGGSLEMLRSSVEVKPRLVVDAAHVQVLVEIVARNVGHHVPTGFIDRQLLLVVVGRTAMGDLVPPESGPVLPPAAGIRATGESLDLRNYGGLGGRLFAKQIADSDGEWPIPFWQFDKVLADTRLQPEKVEAYRWSLPRPTTALVEVRLVYRRFWKVDADRKGWTDIDKIIFTTQLEVR
ncbi:MAG TPA: multiheme c-type cytochrome, partial [Gemmatales bacterium]|nr:multiheme c-type cytochrome [Gemmatales bacterium]